MGNVINDIYPSVPGFVAQINDFGLAIPPTPQQITQSVLILGTATDGPSNTPVSISSLPAAQLLFGSLTTNNTATGQTILNKSLIRGLYEAFQAGCTDVRVCRVGGVSASITLVASVTANNVTVTANYPGIKYNALTAQVSASAITIVTLDGTSHVIGINGSMTYAQVMYAINGSSLNISAVQNNINANPNATASLTTMAATAFSNGDDGTNVTDTVYSENLNLAYAALEDYGTDFVVPMGAYLYPSFNLDISGNPTVPNTNAGDVYFYGTNLAQFVARMSQRFNSAMGIISHYPLFFPTFTQVNQRVAQLGVTAYNFVYRSGYSDPAVGLASVTNGSSGTPVQIGRFLCILSGPDFILNNSLLGNYIAEASASYAGLIVSLPPQLSTTNKIVPNVIGLAYTYGLSSINTLNAQAFTVFNSINGTVRCSADNTYAPNGTVNPPGATASDFQKLSTVRICYAAVEQVRAALQNYIGQGNTVAVSNAMANDVNTALKNLVNSGALQDYQYTIQASATDQILGNVTVGLQLVPSLEIRKIFISVQLNPPGNIVVSNNSGNTQTNI